MLVLFSGWESLSVDLYAGARARRRWHMMALPLDLYELLELSDLLGVMNSAYISCRLEEEGVPRKTARKWPQRLGFRVVLRLAQRGRIAFAILSDKRDLKRAARMRVPRFNEDTYRVGAGRVLVSLLAAGHPLQGKGVRP